MADGHEVAHGAKDIADAVLSCAGLLGIPPITLGAAGAKVLIDLGFGLFFRETERRLLEMRAAMDAGEAAARASAVTTALARERNTPILCGLLLPGRNGRAYHGADCAAHAGCGKEIERT